MKPKKNMLGLFLTIVWYYFVIFITNKYLKEFNVSYFIITIAVLLIGDKIIEHFTPNKNN